MKSRGVGEPRGYKAGAEGSVRDIPHAGRREALGTDED